MAVGSRCCLYTARYLYFLNTSSLLFRGKPLPRTSASVTVQFIGPASVNRFLFAIPDLGEISLGLGLGLFTPRSPTTLGRFLSSILHAVP